jgi:dienelactone hydrolase
MKNRPAAAPAGRTGMVAVDSPMEGNRLDPAPSARAEPAAASDRFARPGAVPVDIAYCDWTDGQRGRAVPAKVYFPRTGPGPFPLVVFSHGTGGSRAGYAFLGEHWASHGYVSLHVQHLGSDQAVWQRQPEPMKLMKAAALDPENAAQRPRDVSFAIDQAEGLQAGDGPLAGRLDLARIGLAGHSFGAHTALAVAGQLLLGPDGREVSLADPRVKAAIAMSPQAPRRRDLAEKLYAPVKIPCFHMTGTRDESPLGLTSAANRRVAFDHVRGADQYLLIFAEGDHMVFADRRGRPNAERDALVHRLILAASTAFWDAYLKDDAEAKAWLAGPGFLGVLGEQGTLEKKLY